MGEIALYIDGIKELFTIGGFLMVALFVLAVVIYSNALWLLVRLYAFNLSNRMINKKWYSLSDITHDIRLLLVEDKGSKVAKERPIKLLFMRYKNYELKTVKRRLQLIRILNSAAPLLGLLGTVMGMIKVFNSLSLSAEGINVLSSVSMGISKALLTTQAGLSISVLGFFLIAFLQIRFKRLQVVLELLESKLIYFDKRDNIS